MSSLYPLKFSPIFQNRIWGGDKLRSLLNKDITSDSIGESWEISTVPNNTSIIKNGNLKGTSLQYLVDNHGVALMGQKNVDRFGNQFPLLIKFLDAQTALSIQLHPNDELAKERHNSFGKTEMWYVLQADDNADLIVGFNQKMTKEKYLEALNANRLPEIMNSEKVAQGDTYFIEVGRVHAIGAGCMIAEIQQTSDVTYRLYDWGRVDANGNFRELHTSLALDAINFDMKDDFRVSYGNTKNVSNLMVDCPYFNTSFLPIDGTVSVENNHDSFIIYMCVNGQALLSYNDFEITIYKGETILVPAEIKTFNLSSDSVELLEVFV